MKPVALRPASLDTDAAYVAVWVDGRAKSGNPAQSPEVVQILQNEECGAVEVCFKVHVSRGGAD